MIGVVRLLLTAVAVYLLPFVLKGVHVEKFGTAIIVALVIALLQFIVRPILVFLTLPITLLTMGLFLFIINAIIILMTAYLVSAVNVVNFCCVLLFSILLLFL